MTNSLIIFFKIKSLFEIFEEIKGIINFQIKLIETDEGLSDFLDKNNNQYVVICSKHIYRSDKLNYLLIKKPMKIDNLIELINISIIKGKYIEQSDLYIKNYNLDINARMLKKGDLKLKLTQKEIEIILFLNSSKGNKSIPELEKEVWGYSFELETHTVETHVYRLRKKFCQNLKIINLS